MKYLRSFLLALQSEFISRVNIVGWFIVALIPPIIFSLVWLSVLGNRHDINGFTKGDFIVYYIFMTMSWYIIGGTFAGAIGRGIKNGTINITLLKPFNVILAECIHEQAWKVLSLIISIPVMAVILYTFRDIIQLHFASSQILLLIISIILGTINFALLDCTIGLSAFWITDSWAVDNVKDILLTLFGGFLVPLTLMPPLLSTLSNILPFKYMFYIPISIFLSKTQNPLIDIGVQFLYAVILCGIYKFVWNLGIKKYEAVGI